MRRVQSVIVTGVTCVAVGALVLGCGSSESQDSTRPNTAQAQPEKTVCKAKVAELPSQKSFTSTDQSGVKIELADEQSGQSAEVRPVRAVFAKSVQIKNPTKLTAISKNGALLFVEFEVVNTGQGELQPGAIKPLFVAQQDETVYYEQPNSCIAARIFTLKHELMNPQDVLRPKDKGRLVSAYVVPSEDEAVQWLSRTTGQEFDLDSQ